MKSKFRFHTKTQDFIGKTKILYDDYKAKYEESSFLFDDDK